MKISIEKLVSEVQKVIRPLVEASNRLNTFLKENPGLKAIREKCGLYQRIGIAASGKISSSHFNFPLVRKGRSELDRAIKD
jgi:hypothetical protein